MTTKKEDRAEEQHSSAKHRIFVDFLKEARKDSTEKEISPITETSQQYLEQVHDETSAPGNMLEQSNVQSFYHQNPSALLEASSMADTKGKGFGQTQDTFEPQTFKDHQSVTFAEEGNDSTERTKRKKSKKAKKKQTNVAQWRDAKVSKLY